MGGSSKEEEHPCFERCYTLGYYFMRGLVFALVWGTSLSCVVWVVTPGCGGFNYLSVLVSLPLLWAATMTTRFYLLAANTDPGQLPREEWQPSGDELRLLQSVVGNRSWTDIRDQKHVAYCRHCERHRPLRAHHCSDCNRCVLRQDHHCPWVTNCVGYHNHKFFILFMFYACIGLFYVLVACIWRALFVFGSDLVGAETAQILSLALDGILSLALLLSIAMLCSYQLWCVGKNTTTIEHYDYSRRKRYSKRHDMPFIYPFDMGWKNNMSIIFGTAYAEWFSATKTYGDGYHEQISSTFLQSLDRGEKHWNLFESDEDFRGGQKKLAKIV